MEYVTEKDIKSILEEFDYSGREMSEEIFNLRVEVQELKDEINVMEIEYDDLQNDINFD